MEKATSVIKYENNKWVIYSKTGKKLSEHNSKKEALKRLRQIEFFKHKQGGKLILDIIDGLSSVQ